MEKRSSISVSLYFSIKHEYKSEMHFLSGFNTEVIWSIKSSNHQIHLALNTPVFGEYFQDIFSECRVAVNEFSQNFKFFREAPTSPWWKRQLIISSKCCEIFTKLFTVFSEKAILIYYLAAMFWREYRDKSWNTRQKNLTNIKISACQLSIAH